MCLSGTKGSQPIDFSEGALPRPPPINALVSTVFAISFENVVLTWIEENNTVH
jgi:hypothetical protein